jgi:hypothetical protein
MALKPHHLYRELEVGQESGVYDHEDRGNNQGQ